MTWLITHWKAGVIAVGLAGAFAAGRLTKRVPPPPAVHQTQATATQKADDKKIEVREVAGPVRIVTQTVTKYRDAPARGCPAAPEPTETVTTTTETRDPVTTDTKSAERSTEKEKTRTDLTVTPAPSIPGWAAQVGLEDLTGSRELRFAARRRLLGQLWIEGSFTPARPAIGAALSFNF